MNKKIVSALKYILFTGGGIYLFYRVLQGQDFDALMDIMYRTNWYFVVASCVCGYLAFVSRGMRWMQLLRPMGMEFRTIHAVNAVNFGYFANSLVPRIGEVARCTVLGKKVDAPVDKLLGTVILERVIDTIMLMILFGLVAVLKAGDFLDFVDKYVKLPSTSKLVVVGILAVAVPVLLVFLFRRWGRRTSLKPLLKLMEWLRGMRDGLKSIRQVQNPGLFIFHTIFIWGMYFIMTYLCFFALPELTNLSLSDGLFIMLAGGIGMVIPSPGGIGSYHYAVITAMVFLTISEDIAVAFATLVHGAQTLMILITGIVATAGLFWVKKLPNS